MKKKDNEKAYIHRRLLKAHFQSVLFYLFRIFPIKNKKVTFTCIEGTTGFSCNPKYIALELINCNKKLPEKEKWQLVWLVNDISKSFPKEIRVKKNTLINRAFALTTSRFWIDNSRKQLEVRKRKGQIYIQTWHAKIGFKPTCLDRGSSFSRIAYLVSKHDSDMVDYWLSNSDWYDKTLKTGSLYEGKTLRTGSPRCDILVKAANNSEFKDSIKRDISKKVKTNLARLENDNLWSSDSNNTLDDIHYLMYAPTFRGGSQGINRSLDEVHHMPDFKMVFDSFEKRFGGKWIILLRLHPQMTVRNIGIDIDKSDENVRSNRVIDISKEDDMYEYLAGCDAFMTDYSSAAFDAAIMMIPVFLYCDDYEEYERERGKLLWNLRKIPFSLAENNNELVDCIRRFDNDTYLPQIKNAVKELGLLENGLGSVTVVDCLDRIYACCVSNNTHAIFEE